MNYFAHAYRYLDDPYFMAGTGVPDWLSVVDRRVRVRRRHVEEFLEKANPTESAVARGILQHLADDAHFHSTRAFTESCLELTVLARDALGDEDGFRPGFLGHLLVEVLLDAVLIAEDPPRLEAYYRTLGSVDSRAVEAVVNAMAPRPTERLADMISGFCRHRILSDYTEDAKLLLRLGQVMRRVKLPPLPETFASVLPAARQTVAARRDELLEGIPTRLNE
ncbi:MAG: hypothetical protein HQ581_21700 [Planctomycetes bacterium]|nr:hypothetical protein [Planctomycetota bacterium]